MLLSMNFLMFVIYNLALLLASPFLLLFSFWRLVLRQKSWRKIGERVWIMPAAIINQPRPLIWLHSSCVGEAMAARPIRQAISNAFPQLSCINSAFTPDGMSELQRDAETADNSVYFPLDFLPCAWLALRRARPQVLILVETELWPNFLMMARHYGAKIIIVNGRISERSFKTAIRIAFIYRWVTSHIDAFCMQSTADAERIIRLGADPAKVTVVGNSKFDQPMPTISTEERQQMLQMLNIAADKPVVLAGSTHAGEEEVVLEAFQRIKVNNPATRLIIAPRDITRAAQIAGIITAHGFSAQRRSQISPSSPASEVIILDTIGELARVYSLSTVVFVGGSLLPVGGHNILEALACGKTALFGPHMQNFRDIAAIALQEGVGFSVHNARELADRAEQLLQQPQLRTELAERATQVMKKYAGASTACAAEVAKLLKLPF